MTSVRELIGIVLTVALPWIAGALGVAALWRERAQGHGLMCIGYGYLLGATATTLILRAASIAGWRWSFAEIAAVLAVLAGIAWYAARPMPMLRSAWARSRSSLAALPPASRRIFALFLALATLNVVALLFCVLWGLLLPYDAITHWADKARVWFEYGRIMPFVGSAEWLRLGDAQVFWDPNPGHPGAVPLLQVWTVLGLGRWDESLMNLPWVAAFVAFGCAFYAQARRLGTGTTKAMVCTYLLLSLPLLQINVAVSGMADMFVGMTYGLAAASLWLWARTRAWQDAALAVLMALACVLFKNEGVLWAATLLPAAAVAVHRRSGLAFCGALAGAALLYLAFGPGEVAIMGYTLKTHLANVAGPMLAHMLVMDNWHLFWYAALAIIVLNARRLLDPPVAAMTATVGAGAAFVIVVYFFSSAAGGVNEESLVNRFLLQAVPALAFYLVALLQHRAGIAIERQPTLSAASAAD